MCICYVSIRRVGLLHLKSTHTVSCSCSSFAKKESDFTYNVWALNSPICYILMKSSMGIQISCASVQWANSFEVQPPPVNCKR